MKHKLYSVSFIIPTLNAEKYLEKCLKSIKSLDYPEDKIEIVIADGGSTDRTLVISKAYDAKVFSNSKRTAEYGKKIAFDHSIGDIIVFLDSDNVIASRAWLKELLYPFIDQNIVGVESNYLVSNDFTSLNKYVSLLGIADPLARQLASKPISTTKFKHYIMKKYDQYSIPIAGANGFLWRREVLEKFGGKRMLNEISILSQAAKYSSVSIGNVQGVGIYHYYCTGLRDYVKKRIKIANKHLSRRHSNDLTWVEKRGLARLVFCSLYLFSIVGPTVNAVYMSIRYKQIVWLWHPLISFLSMVVYTSKFINYKIKSI